MQRHKGTIGIASGSTPRRLQPGQSADDYNKIWNKKLVKREPGWSHQHDLEAAIGKEVVLFFSVDPENQSVRGHLVAADQFTMKIRGTLGTISVWFKSSLAGFKVIE